MIYTQYFLEHFNFVSVYCSPLQTNHPVLEDIQNLRLSKLTRLLLSRKGQELSQLEHTFLECLPGLFTHFRVFWIETIHLKMVFSNKNDQIL